MQASSRNLTVQFYAKFLLFKTLFTYFFLKELLKLLVFLTTASESISVSFITISSVHKLGFLIPVNNSYFIFTINMALFYIVFLYISFISIKKKYNTNIYYFLYDTYQYTCTNQVCTGGLSDKTERLWGPLK